MATDEQSGPTTPEDDIRILYKRVARLNDHVSALLNPAWGTKHDILPNGHPLRTTQPDAEERARLNAVLDTAQARADREAVNRVRALAEGEYYGITGRAFLAALEGDGPAQMDAEEQGAPVDWQAIARQRERELKAAEEARHRAETERDRLRTVLADVLGRFVHKGHPGEPCLQTGWIAVRTVERWRQTLNSPAVPVGEQPHA